MSAVEAVTAQMANASIGTDQTPINGDQHAVSSQTEAANTSASEGRRLYVGNLAYATTERELKDFFKDFLVESTSIPTNPRNNRPVGYAFVDLSSASEAERAIQELNGQSIIDRKVSIQLARKPEPAGEGATSSGESAGNDTRRRSSQRGRGRGRGRGGRFACPGGKPNLKDGGDHAAEGDGSNVSAKVLPLTDVTNTQLTANKGNDGDKYGENGKGPTRHRIVRERKQRGPPEDGIPSKTKIMVANLPYELRDDKLLEIFKDYSPITAKIALRPIPRFMVKKLQSRGEPRKGRGFGFVTFASEEMQQRTCEEMNGKIIEGREIAVKVAIDSPGKEDEPSIDNSGEVVEEGENKGPATLSGVGQVPAVA